MMEQKRDFGKWIRAQRKKYALTQAELAARLHCATITVRKIENGERVPSSQLTEALAHALGVVPSSLAAFGNFARTGILPSAGVVTINATQLLQESGGDQKYYSTRIKPPVSPHRPAYLLNASSDQLLLEIQGHQHVPIASTTKMMTALIAIEHANLEQRITIKQEILDLIERHRGNTLQLQAGDQLQLKDLLYAMMLPSGDDAAVIIADALEGSMKSFVQLMNQYAQQFHLHDTFFVNPSGTPSFNCLAENEQTNYSTAADLVHIARIALANPFLAHLVQAQRYQLPLTRWHHAYLWETSNELLSRYAGATGVKTGYTYEAGYCLVFSATGVHQQLIGAILQAPGKRQRLTDASTLLNWGFLHTHQ
ncbi:helix-turn-helix domain-containing protein [Ktedonospora formicarum]|uniref:HTH cro/C1-type domain-containing protein n=1 Tax=Ktedonospora formicarum TaxID=2778364 RepID=A0A8J3I4U9_9CHLR|nr:helix-turn-helix domain-containing protein [Ktedonospora formicarum]GHO45963.1 hypothetical protein KSX_41260 [Ktedonospora formicarum]